MRSLLDDQPSDEIKVSSGLYLLARIGKLSSAPGKKIARILSLELRGDGGNSTIQQAAILAHVLAVICLGIKQLAKLRIRFSLTLADGAEYFEYLLWAGEVIAHF